MPLVGRDTYTYTCVEGRCCQRGRHGIAVAARLLGNQGDTRRIQSWRAFTTCSIPSSHAHNEQLSRDVFPLSLSISLSLSFLIGDQHRAFAFVSRFSLFRQLSLYPRSESSSGARRNRIVTSHASSSCTMKLQQQNALCRSSCEESIRHYSIIPRVGLWCSTRPKDGVSSKCATERQTGRVVL